MIVYNFNIIFQIIYICLFENIKYYLNLTTSIEYYKNVITKIAELDLFFIKLIQWIILDLHISDVESFVNNYCDNVPYTVNDLNLNEINKLSKYIDINPNPINSGTIGIIFEGSYQGKKVIIKTKRKNVILKLEQSLDLFKFIGLVMEFIPVLNSLNIDYVLKKNYKYLFNQIDYNQECENINNFREFFKQSEKVVIPETFNRFCNNEIIVMEFLDGYNINSLVQKEEEIKIKQLLNFCSFFNESLFNLNLMHCDLHPGNIIFLNNNKIGIIDFGLVKKLSKKEADYILSYVCGVQQKNIKKMWNIVKNKLSVKINENNPIKNLQPSAIKKLETIVYKDQLPSVNEFLTINNELYAHNLKLKNDFSSLIINMSPQIDLLKMLSKDNEKLLRLSFTKYKNQQIKNIVENPK